MWALWVAVVLVLLGLWWATRAKLAHIPGPQGWPIIGNMMQVRGSRMVVDNLTAWAKQYSDIFKFRIPGEEVVVVCGEFTKEVLVTKGAEFAGRPQIEGWKRLTGNDAHFAARDYDKKLRFIRKLAHKGLRQYSEGVARIETVSLDQMQTCIDAMMATQGKDFNPYVPLHHTISQVMNIMVSGEAAGEGHPLLQGAIDIDNLDGEIGESPMFLLMSNIPYVAEWWEARSPQYQQYKSILKTFTDHWQSFEASYDESSLRGIYDVFYKAYRDSETSDEGIRINKDTVIYATYELYLAGIITTHKAMLAIVLQLANDQQLQAQIQQLLDQHVGDRPICVGDRARLGLIEAVIYETLRFTSHVPFALPHKATVDTSLGPYHIPKDTQVWILTWANHHNDKYFTDPWEFNPQRFLNEDGTLASPESRKMLTPFGAGTRNCVGEVFARTRLFLFTSRLLQEFTLLPPESEKLLKLDPTTKEFARKLPFICPEYKIRAVPRYKMEE